MKRFKYIWTMNMQPCLPSGKGAQNMSGTAPCVEEEVPVKRRKRIKHKDTKAQKGKDKISLPVICILSATSAGNKDCYTDKLKSIEHKDAKTRRETAAEPRNICSNEYHPSQVKVRSTEILNGKTVEEVHAKPAKKTRSAQMEYFEKYAVVKKEITFHPTGQSIPEGLHVYRQLFSRENTTPAGVARSYLRSYFYKHLIPLESISPEGYFGKSNTAILNVKAVEEVHAKPAKKTRSAQKEWLQHAVVKMNK